MFPSTPDYNQHLFAYLHAWRQFLEQLMNLTSIGYALPTVPSGWPPAPFMPPGGQILPPMPPFMPPVMSQPPAAPVPPPAPADYTEQLFGYLQAWRQYLEQATSATPGSRPPCPPAGPTPPGSDTGGKPTPGGPADKGPNPLGSPQQVDVPPANPGGSLAPPTGMVEVPPTSGGFVSQFKLPGVGPQGPFGPGSDAAQLLNPPDYAFGYLDRSTAAPDPAVQPSEAAAQLPVASPFSAVMGRVEPTVSPPPAPKSLFSIGSAEVASAKIEAASPTHSL